MLTQVTVQNQTNQNQSFRQSRLEWIVILLILIVAAFLRFYQLDRFPPGLDPDEASEALVALEMLENGIQIFSTSANGREPLFTYFVDTCLSRQWRHVD